MGKDSLGSVIYWSIYCPCMQLVASHHDPQLSLLNPKNERGLAQFYYMTNSVYFNR